MRLAAREPFSDLRRVAEGDSRGRRWVKSYEQASVPSRRNPVVGLLPGVRWVGSLGMLVRNAIACDPGLTPAAELIGLGRKSHSGAPPGGWITVTSTP